VVSVTVPSVVADSVVVVSPAAVVVSATVVSVVVVVSATRPDAPSVQARERPDGEDQREARELQCPGHARIISPRP
jgi:hypothetical protein